VRQAKTLEEVVDRFSNLNRDEREEAGLLMCDALMILDGEAVVDAYLEWAEDAL